MPVPKSRDPELARRDLAVWLAGQLPNATSVTIDRFEMPRTSGFSNETMLFDATIIRGDHVETLDLVARVAPAAYVLFPDYDLGLQRRVIETLAATPLPVPKVLWGDRAESSPFGQDFFIMERIDGVPADDLPPYTKRGWLHDASELHQRQTYLEGLQQLIDVADVDWRSLGLEFLSDPRYGDPGLDQELAYWDDFYRWVVRDHDIALLSDTLEWLRANAPQPGPLRLSWGDSRPGNILYRDYKAVGVLDWEMASLSPREADLGWWLAYQVVQAHGQGVADLPGFPGRDEAVRLYEEMSGAAVADLEWWEIFAGFRLGVLLFRLGDMMTTSGLLPPGAPPVEGPTFRTLEYLRER